jgi:hypothetical protein
LLFDSFFGLDLEAWPGDCVIFRLKVDEHLAELDVRFYRVFTQYLNFPFIRGVAQSKAGRIWYCASAQ